MPLLQVRNCPKKIYKKLAEDAKREHRTIAQQTIAALETILDLNEAIIAANKARRKLLSEQVRAMEIPKAVREVDDVKWIREDRNR
jgi:hypothetical protein